MQRQFDVTFSISGKRTMGLYDDNEASARPQAANWTWDEMISSQYADDVAADLAQWCKIKVVAVEDMGEVPQPRPSRYSAASIEALKRVLRTYGLDAFKTYDGSVDHPYRDMDDLTMALGGTVEGPSPDQLDILSGRKPGKIEASTYSHMTLQKIVQEMLSLRMRLVRVLDDDELTRPLREGYRRLAKELRFRDQDEAVGEWARQTGGSDAA